MKPIVIPIVLLVLVMVFVVFNGLNVSKDLKTLLDRSNNLPNEPKKDTLEQLEIIEDIWNRHKEHISFVVKYDFIFNVEKEISTAKSGVISDDAATFLSAKKGMINLFEYIREVQRFRLDNII